jgi:hypothetical protein
MTNWSHPGFVWVMVLVQGKGTLRNARQRTLPASAWSNSTMVRLRGQTRHAIAKGLTARSNCPAPITVQSGSGDM